MDEIMLVRGTQSDDYVNVRRSPRVNTDCRSSESSFIGHSSRPKL
jgi:hypothetical protein